MAKSVTIDEIHLTFSVPSDLTEDEAEAVREALASNEFMARLRGAARRALQTFSELRMVRVSLTR